MRQQSFHPLHRCTTVDVKQLAPQRATVLFDSRGRQVVQDDWMNPRANVLPQVVERWRGYTFFRAHRLETTATGASHASSSTATATVFGSGYPNERRFQDDLESDGSFERVDGS